MDLYLLRHADANTEAESDDDRKLSEKGAGQAKKVARFCEAHDLDPDIIISSPVRRAYETAEIVAEHLEIRLARADWLACGMTPERAIESLLSYAKSESVMLVGHQPDLGRLAAYLLGLPDPEQIRVRKASLTKLECVALGRGSASLQWTLPCRLM